MKLGITSTLIAVTAMMVSRSTPASQQTVGSEEAAIRAVWARFEEAFNRGDAKTIASIYSVNGDRINQQGELASGRDAIERQYRKQLDDWKAEFGTRRFHADLAIRFVRPDVAIVDGRLDSLTTATSAIVAHFTVIAEKQSGNWLIAAGRVGPREERRR